MTKKQKDQVAAVAMMMDKMADTEFLIKIAVCYPKAVLGTVDQRPVDTEIKRLYKKDKKIRAIKLCREKFGLGLRDAKEYCDKISNFRPRQYYGDNQY